MWTDPDSGMRVTSEFAVLGDGRTEVHIHQVNVPRPSRRRRPRLASSRRSTVSGPTWPPSTHRTRPVVATSGNGLTSPTWPGHRRGVPGAGRAPGFLSCRGVGRALAVRGLANPRGGGARDDAGALFRAEFMAELGRSGVTSPGCPMSWPPATERSPSPGCSTICAPTSCTPGDRRAAVRRRADPLRHSRTRRHRGRAPRCRKSPRRGYAPCSTS